MYTLRNRRGLGAACVNGSAPSTTWENLFGCTLPAVTQQQMESVNPLDAGSNIAAWWCSRTGLCSSDTVKASQALLNPEVAYPPMAAPPAVKPPANLTVPPASGVDAQQTVTDILAGQMEDWQAQNQSYFNQAGSFGGGGGAMPWGTLILAGVVVFFGLATLTSSGPRRYGR